MSAMETFYCMSYKIDHEDRHHYKGRAKATKFETIFVREKGERRTRYAGMRADWWSRTEVILSKMVKHRKKGKCEQQQRVVIERG